MARLPAFLAAVILSVVIVACAAPTLPPSASRGPILLEATPSPPAKPTAGPTAPARPAPGSTVPLTEIVTVGPSGATASLAPSPPASLGPNDPTRLRPAGTKLAGNPTNAAQIEFTGQFDRASLPIGGKLSLTLGVVNRSNRAIDGLRVYTEGPWATLTGIRVIPNGAFSRGNPGSYEIRRSLPIQPGETVSMTVVAFADEPGNLTFSFLPFELDGTVFRAPDGGSRSIGGMVTVYR